MSAADPMRELVLPRLGGVKKSGAGFMARCPAHDDGTASLSIGTGRDQPVVLKCQTGCDPDDILARLGLTWAELCKPRDPHERRNGSDDTWIPCGWDQEKGTYDRRHRKIAEYPYRDAEGTLVFGVARCALKGNGCQGFRQWRPDPDRPGKRKWSRTLPDGTKAGENLIYRLPEILDSDAMLNVWNAEGEKDCDRLWSLGIPATTNPQGGSKGKSKWTAEHADWLTGRDIIIVADRDDTGWKHAENVTNTLMDLARSIEIVRARTGKDISDHLDHGHTTTQVVTVATPKPPPTIGPDGLDIPAR